MQFWNAVSIENKARTSFPSFTDSLARWIIRLVDVALLLHERADNMPSEKILCRSRKDQYKAASNYPCRNLCRVKIKLITLNRTREVRDKQTDKQTDRKTDRQTVRKKERKKRKLRQTVRQKNAEMKRQVRQFKSTNTNWEVLMIFY